MKKLKLAAQLAGLAVWTAGWLGAQYLILQKMFPEKKKDEP